MSAPFLKVKHVALVACLAWAFGMVWATAAPAKEDHKGTGAPSAAQHDQDKAAKDAEKAAEQAAKDADKAQEKAQKQAEKQARKDEHAVLVAAPVAVPDPAIVVETPSAVPHQEIAQALLACTSRRLLEVRLRHPRGAKFRSASVTLNGKRIATRRGKQITAPIDLRGLPKGSYTVVIRAVTTKGKVLRGTRTYHTCVGPLPHRAPKL